jgi:DNA-binding transcriptional LysR family regulator
VSAPGTARLGKSGIDFQMLRDLPLVLPRHPSHWRSVLDQTARSMGFVLNAQLEADSLKLQKEAVACNPHLHALLGPFTLADDVRAGRLVATKIRRPELKRYVTLAYPKQGKTNPATKAVAALIQSLASGWCGKGATGLLDT